MVRGVKHDLEYCLKLAQECEVLGGNWKAIATKHALPVATVLGWYMRYKTFGAEAFKPKNKKGGLRGGTNLLSRLSDAIKTLESLEKRIENLERQLLVNKNPETTPVAKKTVFSSLGDSVVYSGGHLPDSLP